MLVKCPNCGEVVRARHKSFRHCGHQYLAEDYKLSGSNPSRPDPSESDPVKDAIAKRIERGELEGEVSVPVKGVPVQVQFKATEGNPTSRTPRTYHGRIQAWAEELGKEPDPYLDRFDRIQEDLGADRAYGVVIDEMKSNPDNPSGKRRGTKGSDLDEESEGKIKVFNSKKAKPKIEEKVKETLEEEGSEEVEKVKREKGEEVPKCPKCDAELAKVKEIEDSGFLKVDLKKGFSPYICEDCGQLYQVKDEKPDPETNDNCPYCDEELATVRRNENLLWCADCHKIFAKD